MTEKWTGSMFMDSNAQKIVEFKNIDKEFPGVKALDNVSMDIYKGEAVALLGANGAPVKSFWMEKFFRNGIPRWKQETGELPSSIRNLALCLN